MKYKDTMFPTNIPVPLIYKHLDIKTIPTNFFLQNKK